MPAELIPSNPPAMAAVHKGARLCHHPHVARRGTGGKGAGAAADPGRSQAGSPQVPGSG